MAKRKNEVKNPRAKKPLAAIIAEQFAKRGPTPFLFNLFNKTLTEKERRSAITFWQCFYLNDIMVKCIYKEEEERVHDE